MDNRTHDNFYSTTVYRFRTFVRRLEVAQPAHVLLVLEVDAVEVEGQVALGEGLERAKAARNHLAVHRETSFETGLGVTSRGLEGN